MFSDGRPVLDLRRQRARIRSQISQEVARLFRQVHTLPRSAWKRPAVSLNTQALGRRSQQEAAVAEMIHMIHLARNCEQLLNSTAALDRPNKSYVLPMHFVPFCRVPQSLLVGKPL